MAQKTEEFKCLVVVKIRGLVSAQREARETLMFLHLTHTNHAVIIDSRPAYKGMLQRVNSYVTWGEPTKETVAMMLQKRARLAGDKKLTEEYLQKAGYKSIDELAEAIRDCKVNSGNFLTLSHVSSCIRHQRLQRQNQKRLQRRRRSRLPRRSNKHTSSTHGLKAIVN